MTPRKLGRDGPEVFPMGLGAMSFAGIYGEATEAESHETLAAALDLGVDHIDTANVYGNGRSEEIIGAFLKANPSTREAFKIATKASITRKNGERAIDNSPEHLEAELDASLKRLGVDHVALFYVHRRDPDIPIEDVTETLAALVRSGKIGAFGYSEIAPASLARAAAVHPVAAVQSEYSLATRAPDLGLTQTCAEVGAALVAFSPVMRGMLTDTMVSAERVAATGFFRTNPRFQEPNFSANRAKAEAFAKLAAEMGTSAEALCIAWLLTRGEHVIPIPGTRSADHLKRLAAGAELSLFEDDLARIDAVLPVGWAHGDRYSLEQWIGPERYC